LYKFIVPSNVTDAENGVSTDGLHGLWPGQAAVTGNVLSGAPFTLSQLTTDPGTTLVGTGPFMYRHGSTSASDFAPGGAITLDAYPGFFLTPAPGAIALKYTWLDTNAADQPSGGYYKVGLADLVLLANAYGTTGTPPSAVSISGTPGAAHTWNPGADLAAPSGVIGLSDLVTLALHYGWYFGNYSYEAPYPPSEIANAEEGGGSKRPPPAWAVPAVQATDVNITAEDESGNPISVPVYMNSTQVGNTPYSVTITAYATFSLSPYAGTLPFIQWNYAEHHSGIGIHLTGIY